MRLHLDRKPPIDEVWSGFPLRLARDSLTQRTGVLVLRVWLEDGEQDGVRARIT